MDLNQFVWIIPLTLLILIIVQIVYSLWVRLSPNKAKPPALRPQHSPSSAPIGAAPLSPTAVQMSTNPPPPPGGNVPPARKYNAETSAESINKFVILSGLQGVKEMRLPSKEFRIGRYYNLEGNILVGFDEKSVSRKHALLSLNYDKLEYYLTDTDSSYGTYLLLEGTTEQLTPRERKRVYNGDVIRFGNSVTVRLIVIGETRASTTHL